MIASDKAVRVEGGLQELVGLQLTKSWHVFATRIFYFTVPQSMEPGDDKESRLVLECPWRIEQGDRIVAGAEDYGLRAEGNEDPSWDPATIQLGHLLDQNLAKMLGGIEDGCVVAARGEIVVESVTGDAFGGFRLHLSGGYTLAAFPASEAQMEWHFSGRSGSRLALMNGVLSSEAAT